LPHRDFRELVPIANEDFQVSGADSVPERAISDDPRLKLRRK
jgi:hypothetical protein